MAEKFSQNMKLDKRKKENKKLLNKEENYKKLDNIIKLCEEVAAKQFALFQGINVNLQKTANKHKETLRKRNNNLDEAEEEIDERRVVGLIGQPRIIQGSMRNYQIDALNWLVNLHKWGYHGILADEMGLGKTLETISLFGYLLQLQIATNVPEYKRMKHICIVPKSTV